MRYLSTEFIRTALNLGKTVSQWLPPRSEGDQTILRWVSLSPTGNTITVTYEEVFDVPEAGTYDVGEFPAVNPDEPYGVSEELPTLDEALSTASARWGAHPDRYVNEGMLGHEYEAYKRG